jgi:hypothetical protein
VQHGHGGGAGAPGGLPDLVFGGLHRVHLGLHHADHALLGGRGVAARGVEVQ